MPSSSGYLHRVQLTDAWLSEASFRDNPAFRPDADVTYHVESQTDVDLEGPDAPVATLRLRLLWSDLTGDRTEGPFELVVAITGEFRSQGPIDASFGDWLDFNSQYLLWPYARTYIAALTSASRHRPLTLFTLQLPRPRAFEPETGEFQAADDPNPGPAFG